ncbi:TetR/AcrR family transcriptional regulator [Planococcus halotolerans]|nr:TetR/AcrR family transcriptional regulator [Planococcus halotolerans]QHJ72156.1 TetR family transcriptional regulator [Planococcus halotolerans]
MKSAKETIIESLLQLLANRNFDAVSVKDIVQQAEISRSTFYLHFTDKYQLMDEVRKSLNDQFLRFYTETSAVSPVTYQICQHIFFYRSFYSHEFSNAVAIHHLSNELAVRLHEVFNDQDYAIFASYGTIGYLCAWVEDDFRSSPGEAAEKLMKIGFTDWTESISFTRGEIRQK